MPQARASDTYYYGHEVRIQCLQRLSDWLSYPKEIAVIIVTIAIIGSLITMKSWYRILEL